MSRSDAILVGEGWISEHYFTTDATKESFRAKILERRAGWDAEENAGRSTPRSRFLAARRKLEVDLATLSELFDPASATEQAGSRTAHEVPGQVLRVVRDVLGLDAPGLIVSESGPLSRVSSAGASGSAPLVVLAALPVAAIEELLARDAVTLGQAVQLTEDGEEIKSAARLLSALFVADDAPELALVLAGRWALLAERERWAEGRYLAVDLQSVCERNDIKKGGEIDRALACLCAESIAPDADGKLWWHSVLEASVKHTVGVSQDLRDGVRLSIEIVANEVVARRRAQGLSPLPKSEAQPLARQSLRFLYRILFLLYAEASPELGVLPVGAPEYDQGYSLDRLRELVQVELATPRARAGTHLYESLGVLFRLVDKGHPKTAAEEGETSATGLVFNPLRADLFRPEATAHIDAVGLGNVAVQQVLAHLLLSKEQRGRDRGFISYAELGINQLGAVYEGLMSYTGFFADTDLYEVAKNGDGAKGSWVVPVDRADGIAATDFVTTIDPATGERRPVLHRQGTFVFRLAGRERQQSASYYTPEVLTRFTVGQALEELLTDDTPAEQILTMTICEPALGSGAFAIEAVRQLADEYLKRRQKELEQRIDPDEYPKRLQEVKAYLALHNVYGVDLNETAVELAEISLWLDTMVEGLSAPWFGLHLRRGNSLIGARRAVYRRSQVTDKSWLGAVPQEVPLTRLVEDIDAGKVATDGVHHFLLPADGWGSAADAKEAAALAPDAATRLKKWRGSTKTKPSKTQVDAYAELAHRVETLWQIAYRRLAIAEQEIRRSIPVWGVNELPAGGDVQREQIERALADEEGAYRRLRRAMDAWTALWFWPLTDTLATVDGEVIQPPMVTEWIAGLRALLGRNPDVHKRKPVELRFGVGMSWDELGEAERLDLGFASAESIDEVLQKHPWLVVCERIARRQGFFHWNLDFVTVFARGGFDLQVGNPPWVRPIIAIEGLLAEGDPWWQLSGKADQSTLESRRRETLRLPGIKTLVIDGVTDTACVAGFVGSLAQYPHLQGFQPDLYRCFTEQMWRNSSQTGIIAMIHYETHFTDERAGPMRSELYRRLRRHWHFQNKLKLFEIKDEKQFGVTVQGSPRSDPSFVQACWLYHPHTIERSLQHDGSGPEPGMKDEFGMWDLRPHRGRLTWVNTDTIRTWQELLESTDELLHTKMVFTVNQSAASMLNKLSDKSRIGELGFLQSDGWHETGDWRKGYFETGWAIPKDWQDVILQGSHIFVARPLYKTPNPTLKNKDDWSPSDLESLSPDAIPATGYQPAGERHRYDRNYTHWEQAGALRPTRDYYRMAWRRRAANTGERTLMSALIPPGAAHVNTVQTAGHSDGGKRSLLLTLAITSSLIADFLIRCVPKDDIRMGSINRLPRITAPDTEDLLTLRTLRLNCITNAYSGIWRECYSVEFERDDWLGGFEHGRRRPLGQVGSEWVADTPLRIAADRRQALVEIDALVAYALGLSADELCTVYRTQFAVLYGYDRNGYYYDANGRLVPNSVLTVWRKKGDRITAEERTATNQAGYTYTYELPFVTLDREADMRQAYAVFEQRLRERQ
ncbi:class I SAM-dependent DNA methyltransferase [Verrucosispora sp. SN26_14.1]|uniref:Eco57I restriction-modification methylase domain-containing protein n=1 Tax=Verrucosispora sp. SN26_14.1 TaxID=2527879 RepID=UPI001034F813|nr:DNA methyltransferase [Verrucosispora sp. SN26_14.1]TBL44924.1 class I SAM-dependent DNA methyltransferase [Verrucosispora sp. SN26_14.1]